MNFKYYRKLQRGYNSLIMFTHLMTSKLIYLLIDCEKFNLLVSLNRFIDLFRAHSNMYDKIFAKNNSEEVHFNCVNGYWMSLCRWIQHSFCNSKRGISLAAKKDDIILIHSLHLKFRSVICLSIMRSLKHLS